MRQLSIRNTSPSLRLALVYLFFSTGWILLSDEVLLQFHYSAEMTKELQNLKGLLFVSASGLLLFYTSRRIYRQLQLSLKARETALEKLEALNNASLQGIIDYDFANNKAGLNEQMRQWLKLESAELNNFLLRHRGRIHPDDRDRVIRQFDDFMLRDDCIWQTEYRYRNPQGEYRDMVSRGFVLRDAGTRKPLRIMFALQDVTELRDVNARFYQQQIQHRQELTRSMLQAQEQERNRWAEELHDNVCQVLTVAKLYLEQAELENAPAAFRQKANEMVAKAIQDIRQISTLLKPPEFSMTTLYDAIELLLCNLQRFGETTFELKLESEVESQLQLEHKMLLYRMVQEGLNNVVKYAGASRVRVTVTAEEGRVLLSLDDNGQGFDPETVKAGVGLQNIRSRLSAYAGNLIIRTAPGEGCTLNAEFWL